jgi:hypothetical protein
MQSWMILRSILLLQLMMIAGPSLVLFSLMFCLPAAKMLGLFLLFVFFIVLLR